MHLLHKTRINKEKKIYRNSKKFLGFYKYCKELLHLINDNDNLNFKIVHLCNTYVHKIFLSLDKCFFFILVQV